MVMPKTLLSGISIPQMPTANIPVQAVPTLQTPTQSTGLAIPAAFSGLATIPSADELPEGGTIYGYWVSNRSKSYTQCLAAGAAEGDAVIKVEGNLIACKPLKFFLVAAAQFRTKMEMSGDISAVSLDMSKRDMDEHYVTMLLVLHGETLIPCKFDFRTTKAKAAIEAIRAQHQSQTPEWGKLSPAHAATVAFLIPWGKAVTEVPTTRKVSGKGLAYFAAEPQVRPATPNEMRLLTEFGQSQDNLNLFSTVFSEYEARVNELKSKVK
jgi:hypothetical protein